MDATDAAKPGAGATLSADGVSRPLLARVPLLPLPPPGVHRAVDAMPTEEAVKGVELELDAPAPGPPREVCSGLVSAAEVVNGSMPVLGGSDD